MSCCGKGKAMKNIISGYSGYAFSNLFTVTGEKAEDADTRMNMCMGCEFITWYTKGEYTKWLLANGRDVVKHLDDLTQLPPLKIQKRESGTSPFCSDCKCWVPAKAYSKGSKCPRDKWSK